MCALLLLYKEVLGRELAWLESMQRAARGNARKNPLIKRKPSRPIQPGCVDWR
ncbi:MAG: hypothetical protein MRJ52_02235 [Nitrosomonas sp.]|nr:hypothetical protein [Nitrosomonas sp.]